MTEYEEYCTRMRAEALRIPRLLEACDKYTPRPGWEVRGCHSCVVAEADDACAELRRRFGDLLPCLRDMRPGGA